MVRRTSHMALLVRGGTVRYDTGTVEYGRVRYTTVRYVARVV